MAHTAVRDPSLSWRARLALALFGIALSLGTAEAGLRVARFHFDLVPTLEFGWPDPVALKDAYVSDPDLVWVTRDYRTGLRAARRSHPSVVFMGDSCTEFGSYPSYAVTALQAGGASSETGVKLGVGGWSSSQGLRQLERDVIPLHPKVITIYYGWNDHWVAMGLTDPEIMHTARLRTLAEHLRLAQLWLKVEVAHAGRRSPRPNRVPLDDYEQNVARIAATARAAGITPVFITAPSGHEAGREPAYLAKRHVRSLADVIPLHAAYVSATRKAAAAAGARVCDAAARFAELPPPRAQYFQKDGIHLTDAGDRAMGTIVASCIADLH